MTLITVLIAIPATGLVTIVAAWLRDAIRGY